MLHRRVADTEGIPGEYTIAKLVVDAEVMSCVTRCIDKNQFPAANIEAGKILRKLDARLGNRFDAAIELLECCFAIYVDRPRDQFLRIVRLGLCVA